MADTRPLVVHVIYRFGTGGLENGLVNLINHMPIEHFRHAVVCIESSSGFAQRLERADVQIYEMQRSQAGVWRLRWRLFQLFRRIKPDIVHTRNLSGLDALLPARLAGCRTVHSEHGFEMDDLYGRARKQALLRRLHAPLIQRHVGLSQQLVRLMCERWGAVRRRTQHICNGVDTDRFKPASGARHALLPVELQGPALCVIGTVGRVTAIKDQATLLRAVAAVLDRRPMWRSILRVVVIGDGPMLGELRSLVAELGLSGQAWLPGGRDDVAALMQAFDVFVLPSLNEGISNTLLEAMATGLPLLATRVGGNIELLSADCGAGFAPGDVAGLSQLIEVYVQDEGLRLQHGVAARRRAEQHFSLQTMLDAYQDAYQSV